jgi:hypothetical protein
MADAKADVGQFIPDYTASNTSLRSGSSLMITMSRLEDVRATVRERNFSMHICSRSEKSREIARETGKRARHFVGALWHWAHIRRSQIWLNRFRRLLVRWEKSSSTNAPSSTSPVA